MLLWWVGAMVGMIGVALMVVAMGTLYPVHFALFGAAMAFGGAVVASFFDPP